MSTSSTRSYTRFIPGEEISDAVQWQFGDIGGDVDVALLPSKGEADEPPPEPGADPTVEEHVQQVHDAALAEGIRQGQAQATQEWQHHLDDYVAGEGRQAAERLEAVARALEESFAGLQQKMADELLQLACDIARQVLRQELQSSPRALLPVVREALATFVQESRPATVRLHPLDWKLLESSLREEFGGARVVWQPDPSVAQGGCTVECAGAVVDGSLDTRWRRAIAALGLVSAWREMGDAD